MKQYYSYTDNHSSCFFFLLEYPLPLLHTWHHVYQYISPESYYEVEIYWLSPVSGRDLLTSGIDFWSKNNTNVTRSRGYSSILKLKLSQTFIGTTEQSGLNSLIQANCIFCGFSVWRHNVQDVPLPHDWWEPPTSAGANGRERPLIKHPQTVCQTAAGGGRREV